MFFFFKFYLVGTRKAKSDAAAMFKVMDIEQKNYVTWGQVITRNCPNFKNNDKISHSIK